MRLILLLAVSLLASSHAVADDDRQFPPSQYKLSDVTISLVKTGVLRNGKTVYEISGTGKGHIRTYRFQGIHECEFEVGPDVVVSLINQFHAAYFFDMGDRYSFPYTAQLEEDGLVRTSSRTDLHASGNIVRIQIGDFEKVSSFVSEGPARLESLAKRIQNLAETGCVGKAYTEIQGWQR